MNLDISKVKFEEAYDNTPFEEYTLYFIAPKDLVKDKHPEADHSTISLELRTRTAHWNPVGNISKIFAKITTMITGKETNNV